MAKRVVVRLIIFTIAPLFLFIQAAFIDPATQPYGAIDIYDTQVAYIELLDDLVTSVFTRERKPFSSKFVLSNYAKSNQVVSLCEIITLVYFQYYRRPVDFKRLIENLTTQYFHGSKYKRTPLSIV